MEVEYFGYDEAHGYIGKRLALWVASSMGVAAWFEGPYRAYFDKA